MDFSGLTEKEFEKTIAGLEGLSVLIAPILLNENYEGQGVKDAAEATLDLQIGAMAVREIKEQLFGKGGAT
jgi:hypothetical protein